MDSTTPPPPTLVQRLGAEAIGTFVLIVLGVGSVAVLANAGPSEDGLDATLFNVTSIGLAFGIAIVAMVYSFGRVSGGHFNPAVSVGAALGGRISWKDAGLYCAAQVAGGIAGGLVLAIILITGDTGYELGDPDIGQNFFGDEGGIELFGALIIELVLTFIFLTVILAVTDERNEHPALAPLAIGLTLAAIHFVAIPATGTSVNPARSIGVGLFAGTDAIVQLWLFIVAPLLGGALAGLAYPAIFGHASDPVPGSGLNFGAKAGAVPGYGAPDQFQQQWNQPGVSPAYSAPDAGYQQGGYDQGAVQGGYDQGGFQPPQQGDYQQAATPAPAEQPIIQDGWQWDPQAQQWIPAQQQPPAPGAGGSWPTPGEQTQVRPTDNP